MDSNRYQEDDIWFQLKTGNKLFEENGDYRRAAIRKQVFVSIDHNI